MTIALRWFHIHSFVCLPHNHTHSNAELDIFEVLLTAGSLLTFSHRFLYTSLCETFTQLVFSSISASSWTAFEGVLSLDSGLGLEVKCRQTFSLIGFRLAPTLFVLSFTASFIVRFEQMIWICGSLNWAQTLSNDSENYVMSLILKVTFCFRWSELKGKKYFCILF